MRLTPVAGAARSTAGVLVFDLSLPDLLSAVGDRLRGEGGYAVLVDQATGAVIGDSRDAGDQGGTRPGPAQLGSMLGDLLAGSGGAADRLLADGWATSVAPIGDATGTGWSVVVLRPATAPTFPLALLVALLAMSAAGVIVAAWMSRQVLVPSGRPAVVAPTRPAVVTPQQELQRDALRDPLTGLGNHRAFQEELERQLEWYERHSVPFALMLLDVDDLGALNERDGHAAGDEALRAIGARIRQVARYADRGFRITDDEFALLMPHTDVAGARNLGARLLARSLRGDDGSPATSFSAGISACPELATARQPILAQARAALAWCKGHGRGTLDVFSTDRDVAPGHDARAPRPEAASLGAQVAAVARERSLRAVFQPIVDLISGKVMGFEGLVRPLEGTPFANPGALFSAAEASGRIVELDAACFEVVATAASAISPERLISFNLSPRTVEAPDFSADAVVGTLERHGISPARVVIELTEREAVGDLARLQRNLAELQRTGVRVAADDVGAGNAGLRLLSQFRFDIVKIDLSLVQDGVAHDTSRAVLRSLRDLAGRWGAFVIAEGIETPEQLRVVREMGLAAGQGYLLGRPGTALELPPLDLAGLADGHLLLQNAPAVAMERADVLGRA
jgi:diguanylate cyclase (GGDEF)-like protein